MYTSLANSLSYKVVIALQVVMLYEQMVQRLLEMQVLQRIRIFMLFMQLIQVLRQRRVQVFISLERMAVIGIR